MTKEQLQKLVDEYVATLDAEQREERWQTEREYARWELDEFVEWFAKRPAHEPAAPSATSDEETCPKCGELNVSPYLCKVHGDTRTLNRQTESRTEAARDDDLPEHLLKQGYRSGSVTS